MNLTVQASELRAMVARLKPVRSPRQPWAARFAASNHGGVKLVCGGFYAQAEAWGNGTIYEALDVAVPLPKLDAWLGGVDGPVTVAADGHLVEFQADGADLTLPVVVDYDPRIPDEPNDTTAIPTEVWAAIPRVAWMAERLGESAPSWRNMIHIKPRRWDAGGNVIPAGVWTCEGHALALITLPSDCPGVSLFPDVAGVAKLCDLDALVTKIDDQGRLHLRDGSGRYVVSTYAGENPAPVDALLKRSRDRVKSTLRLPTVALAEAVGHLRKLKATDSDRIAVDPREGEPLLSVTTDDGLQATRDLPFHCTGECPAVGLNVAYLDGLLDSLDGDEVTFQMGGPTDPIVVDDGALTVVVMPIRLEARARPERKPKKAA